MRLGIDVGSTTVKLVLIDEKENIIYQRYERHMSSVFSKVSELLNDLTNEKGDIAVKVVITGSGGLALAEAIKAKFELSKNSFKRAIGHLYKDNIITIEENGIRLR